MSNQTLTPLCLLKELLKRNNESFGKTIITNFDILLKELKESNIETSRRTLYRRLSELRRDGLIIQTNEYYRKYRLKPTVTFDNVIVVDQDDRILDHEDLGSYNALLSDEGEIKLQVVEITEKGKEYLEKTKKEILKEETKR
ncbi:MAG: hypothetical protein ACXAEU_08710 [Candidatus Hodarchaeales archaeon]|jgi:DNA-binding PadR family transcriptional regulator